MVGGVERFLPLQPDAFEILLALSENELHGYGILKVLESRRISIAASLLYRKLRRLLADDLVRETTRPLHAADDPRRRYYRLTARGRRVLQAEAARIVQLGRERPIRRLAESTGDA
jgi:DNA-binding PadR family transcriptional regulator